MLLVQSLLSNFKRLSVPLVISRIPIYQSCSHLNTIQSDILSPLQMIQPFILRRCKRDVEKQLPKKYEHILKCRLSSRQKSMYEDILTQPG